MKRSPSPTEIRRKVLTRVRGDVELYGQSVIFVGDDPPFSYTVGRGKRGLPELLIVLPLDPSAGKSILNELDRLMPETKPSGSLVNVGGKFPVMLIDADQRGRQYTFAATGYHGGDSYRVQQVLLCDTEGRFPPDPNCAEPYAAQPILGVQ